MPQNTPAIKGPSRGSGRRAGLCPAIPIDVGVRLGADDRLSLLPLDILTLILNNLHPVDIISVSQTSKAFRKFLMNPKVSRSTVWKPVLETIEGLPPCPPDLNEPKLIVWLYHSGECHECGTKERINLYLELRLRLCKLCEIKQFANVTNLRDNMGYDEQIIRMTPTYLFANPRSLQAETRFHTKTVAALADEYERVQGSKAKQAWLDEKKRFWRDRMKHVNACYDALNLERRKEEDRRQEIREQRIQRMKEKLTELGWEREATKYLKENPVIKFAHANSRLTDDEWTKLEPEFIPLMEKEREVFRQEEIGGHIRQRIHKWLKPAHSAFILSQPPNELNPSILDVALSDEWRTLLCTEPFNEDLTESMVQEASAQMPEIARTWRKDRIEQLLEVVRKSKTYSGQEVTEDVLHLSTTIFRCTECKNYYGQGDVHTYPHTLAHACNHPHPREVQPLIQVVPRHLPAPPPPTYGPLPVGFERRSLRNSNPIIRLYREEEAHIVAALRYAGIWTGLSHIFFDDAAHEHMLSLLDVLGWSRHTSASEMEERQPYVECLCECFHNPAKKPSRKILRWKKAIFQCKPRTGTRKKEKRQLFSKLNEDDLVKAQKHEEARHRSTQFNCPWCHNWVTCYRDNPSLPAHTTSCFAIQQPHPPGLKEHAEKMSVLASEERWLRYEKRVPLEEEEDSSSDSGSEINEDTDSETSEDESDSETSSGDSDSDESREESDSK